MLGKFSFLLFLTFSWVTLAQDSKTIFVDSVYVQADKYFGKDILGYDYYSKDNLLYKHKKSEKWEYNNVFLGEIHFVDILNPLKILVFYKNYNFAVLLDSQLSEIETFSFSEFDILAQTCSLASQNRLWVYDGLSDKLILLDYFSTKKLPLNQPFDSDFLYYTSDYNYWYRISQKREVYQYDNYGKITLLGIVPRFTEVLMIDSTRILFTSNENLYLYDIDKKQTNLVFSFKEEIENFNFESGILTIFTGNVLHNYKINLP